MERPLAQVFERRLWAMDNLRRLSCMAQGCYLYKMLGTRYNIRAPVGGVQLA